MMLFWNYQFEYVQMKPTFHAINFFDDNFWTGREKFVSFTTHCFNKDEQSAIHRPCPFILENQLRINTRRSVCLQLCQKTALQPYTWCHVFTFTAGKWWVIRQRKSLVLISSIRRTVMVQQHQLIVIVPGTDDISIPEVTNQSTSFSAAQFHDVPNQNRKV